MGMTAVLRIILGMRAKEYLHYKTKLISLTAEAGTETDMKLIHILLVRMSRPLMGLT